MYLMIAFSRVLINLYHEGSSTLEHIIAQLSLTSISNSLIYDVLTDTYKCLLKGFSLKAIKVMEILKKGYSSQMFLLSTVMFI